MVMSTIDRLREQLAIPSPARPVPAEPNYPAPVSPGPRLFVPPADDGVLRYGDREPPDMPAPVLAHQYSWAGDSGKGHERHASPAISGAPDMPAPVLHHHASSPHNFGRPAMEGIEEYSEMPGWREEGEAEAYGPFAGQRARELAYDELRGSALDMEQQLEMVAMSLRGDQDEAAGVRKGLMMLQPFQASADSDSEYEQLASSRQIPPAQRLAAPSTSPQFGPRPSSSDPSCDPLASPRGAPQVLTCPTDYLQQIAVIETSVLKPGQVASTWTAAQGVTAVCVIPWSARTTGELSIELNETLDMSFFDASCMEQDWWFAVKADKEQTGSRFWRFPQDLRLLRKQAGYFPSKCVRLKGDKIPGPTVAEVQRPSGQSTAAKAQKTFEHKPAARQTSLSPRLPAHSSPISFPVLQPDPTVDPPLVPFANVPLWLPTWAKVSPRLGDDVPQGTPRDTPRDCTPRDRKRDSEESLPMITSATDQTDTTFAFTPVASSANLAGHVINDSDVESPAASGPVSARSSHSQESGAALSLPQPLASEDPHPSNPGPLKIQPDTALETGESDGHRITPLNAVPQLSGDLQRAPQDELRRVQIMRNPSAPPNAPAGIGLQFARPRGQMGACHILALSTEVNLALRLNERASALPCMSGLSLRMHHTTTLPRLRICASGRERHSRVGRCGSET